MLYVAFVYEVRFDGYETSVLYLEKFVYEARIDGYEKQITVPAEKQKQ